MPEQLTDLLLVNPPVNRLCDVVGNYYPLGLGYISAFCNRSGIKTRIYNAELETGSFPVATNRRRIESHRLYVAALKDQNHRVFAEYRQVLDENCPKVVGFSCTSASVAPSMEMAREAKQRGIITIFGGMHPTILPESMAFCEEVDYVLAGEAECSMPPLLNALLSGSQPDSIPGVGWIKDGVFHYTPPAPLNNELDSFPLPDRDHIVFPDRHRPFLASLVTSRGCPYPCTFCSGEKMHQRRVRYRSIPMVIGEIRALKEQYGVRHVTFYDDFLISNRKRIVELCNQLIAEKIDVTWGGFSRADSVDEELLPLLEKAGCTYLGMGVESGSDRTLKKIKKGYTRDAAIRGVRLVKDSGINVGMSIVVGFPFETAEDIQQTISLVNELCIPTNVNTLTPYPGSEVFDECLERGLIPDDGVDWATTSQHSCYNNFIQDVDRAEYRILLDELISAADFATFYKSQTLLDDATLRRMLEVADEATLRRLADLQETSSGVAKPTSKSACAAPIKRAAFNIWSSLFPRGND